MIEEKRHLFDRRAKERRDIDRRNMNSLALKDLDNFEKELKKDYSIVISAICGFIGGLVIGLLL